MNSPITVVIAGSTRHTRQCAESLLSDPRFQITGVITPTPKATGRKREVHPNLMHDFALAHQIKVVLIESRINQAIQQAITHDLAAPMLLLVVDFGYIVPTWLLSWPTYAPVNIHPSDLPKFRGSSPGQFALLFGEHRSAISLIRMDAKLDHGPLIAKLPFDVAPAWTSSGYYSHAFALIEKNLTNVLSMFVDGNLPETPQPDVSQTPTARMLTREDGYISLEALRDVLLMGITNQSVPLLTEFGLPADSQTLYNMWRGLSPWPGIWTKTTKRGKEERVKLLEVVLIKESLILKKIQFEGGTPRDYRDGMLF